MSYGDVLRLYVTRCSANKRKGVHPPNRLYLSKTIVRFVNFYNRKKLPWAILSAKYGLFFPEERHEDYNVTWRSDTQGRCIVIKDRQRLSAEKSREYNRRLAEMVRTQAEERGVDKIVFYAPNPRRLKCYLHVLHQAIENCSEQHNRFDEILNHMKKLKEEGKGKVTIITKLGIITLG